MALQILTLTLTPGQTSSCTFTDVIDSYAIGVSQFGMTSTGGNNADVQTISQKFSASQNGKTISVQNLSQMEPGGLDAASTTTILVLGLTVGDEELNGIGTWGGVPNAQVSAPIQTLGTGLTVKEFFLTGFYFQQSQPCYFGECVVGGSMNVTSQNATILPTLTLQDASGHVAPTATLDATFLQSSAPNPAFCVLTGNSIVANQQASPVPITFPGSPAPVITQAFVLLTGFTSTYGPGHDYPLISWNVNLSVSQDATGAWSVSGIARMDGRSGDSAEVTFEPVSYMVIGLPASAHHEHHHHSDRQA